MASDRHLAGKLWIHTLEMRILVLVAIMSETAQAPAQREAEGSQYKLIATDYAGTKYDGESLPPPPPPTSKKLSESAANSTSIDGAEGRSDRGKPFLGHHKALSSNIEMNFPSMGVRCIPGSLESQDRSDPDPFSFSFFFTRATICFGTPQQDTQGKGGRSVEFLKTNLISLSLSLSLHE